MAQTSNAPNAGDGIKPEDRFRYIGFGVFPGKTGTFWKSDSEAQQYATKVQLGLGEASLHRDFSLLETEPMSVADRWIVTISAVTMLLTVAMPWVSYRTNDATDFSLSWIGALGTLLGGLGTAFSGGIVVGISALLGLVVLVGTPLLGLWTLAMVWRKAKTQESYLLGVRQPLKLCYYVFYAALTIIFLSFFGGQIPGFETWNLIDPPEHYGVGTLFGILSFGFYVALGVSMICGVKSGDL